jgi:RHS repeat-associated protein
MSQRICIALILWSSLLGTSSFAAEGRTAGQFAVSPTGSAQYTIPLWAPPGPRGVQPHLALTYDSHSGIGPLGVGWSVAGLGAVTRCRKTYAQDTTPAAVALTTSDGYCLNGNRLRLTGGSYGAAGSTYQTEIADFSNITANGTAGNGPAYFSVQGRDGLTYQYGYTDANGNGANSQVLASGTATANYWLLSKVIDRAGNNFVVNYTLLTGTAVPSTILWTPTSAGASSYTYTIKFNYGANVPQSSPTKYVGGTAVENAQLLSSISVSSGSTVVRDYFLAYQASPTTGRDELKSVQECADSAQANCFLPTTVSYQDGVVGLSTTSSSALTASGAYLTARYDLNGDGYADLVYSSGSTWYVAFGAGSGYGTPVNAGLNTGNNAAVLIGNLTGASAAGGNQDGLLANNGGTWWYYTWSSSCSCFNGVSTGLAYDSTAQYQLADVNGDGLPDLVSLYVTYNANIKKSTATVDTRLNTSTGANVSFSSTLTTAYTLGGLAGAQLQTPDYQYTKLRRYDFDGDGRDDIVLQAITGASPNFAIDTYELISSGTTFTPTLISALAGSIYTPVFFTNWNDDACTDFVSNGILYISGCNGTVPATSSSLGTVIGAMDWDGDGRTDLVVANGSTLGVYLSTGGTSVALTTTTIPYTSTCQYVTMDVNNDGLDDLGCWSQSGSNPLTYYLHNGAYTPPDLLSSIADGYGNTVNPTYATVAQGSFFWGNQVFPYQNYIGPLYLAVNAVYSDPTSESGGTYSQHFYYAGAATNLQGRGFAGFGAQQVYDSRNGIWETKDYNLVFPYTGALTNDVAAQDNLNAKPIDIQKMALSALTLDSTVNNQRYFLYTNTVTHQQFEVGGAKNTQLITTISTSYETPDSYGNFANVASTVTDNDTGSPYYNSQYTSTVATTVSADHSSNWCLNLPTEVDVTNTAPGSSLTRHTSYTPDYANCRETEQVVEPNSSAYKVTTVYGFDPFGNVNSAAVTGVGMATRATGITWGTTGQFPSVVTNALNQQTLLGYDPNTGLQSSITDPNGIATSWQYDGFARKIKELRPDGTSTTWAYNSCATAGCVGPLNKMTVVQTTVNSDNSTLSISNAYLDPLGRPQVTSKLMANNNYDRNEIAYDNLGRIHQTVAPCVFNNCTKYYTTNSYDMIGRLSQTQRPNSASDSTVLTTRYSYQGRTTAVTDPQNKVTTRVTKVTGSVGRSQDHNGYYINFNHDAFGSLVSVTDSLSNTLKTTTYAYGLQAFAQTSTDMDLGARTYTIDALGETTAYSDAKGQTFSATYDGLSRPTSRTEPDLTTTWTWGSTKTSYNIGKLASVSSVSSAGTYTDAYVYDSVGRPSNRAITLPAIGEQVFNYYYNATTGQLQNLKYPAVSTPSLYRLTANYVYTNGILIGIRDQLVPSTVWWQANTYNARGQVTEETTTDLSGDPAIVTQHAYDALTGRVSTILTGVNSGAALQNESYLYDYVGNVTERQNNNAGLTENFYYDNLYRLDHSTLGGNLNLTMGYDAMGNITSRTDVAGGAAWTYDSTHKHQVTQAGSTGYTYTYDGNGNVRTRNGTTLSWTSYNYPSYVGTSTESASFDYGADRQRWRMIYTGPAGTETTYYATPLFEQVATSSGTDYRHYIYARNKPVVVVSRTAAGAVSVRSLLTDQQGSISSIVANSTGTSYVSESFTAYGNRREASTWTGVPTSTERSTMDGVTREGYTFQTVLGSMGLNHMNGRVEDAITGRFLSSDPYVPNPSDTQSFNRYSYASNNPLTRADPSGFDDAPHVDCEDTCSVDSGGSGDGSGGSGNGDCVNGMCPTQTVTSNRPGSSATSLTSSGGNPTTAGGSGGGGGNDALPEVIVQCTRNCGPDTVSPPGVTISSVPLPFTPMPQLPRVAAAGSQSPIIPCPGGLVANVEYGLFQMGKGTVSAGKTAVAAGTGVAIVAAPFVETPVGAAAEAGAGITVAAGGATTLTGYSMQLLAGSALSFQGDPQPLDSLFASLFNMNMVPGVPSITPTNPLGTAVTSLAGSGTCQH